MHVQWLIPIWAWPLLLLLTVVCWLWARRIYGASQPPPPDRARRLLISLRTAACVLVVLAVARPLLVRQQTVPTPAVVAVVIEDSGSMSLQDRPERADRWSQAWQIAAAVDSAVSDADEAAEVVFLRGNGRRPLRETTPAVARTEIPGAVGTDLPGLINQARQTLLGQPLRGLVVLGDGHAEDHGPPVAPPGLPLWLVGVGDVVGPPDRFLASLRYPDRVQRDQPLVVDLTVGQSEVAGDALAQPITVRLLHGGEVVDEQAGPAADLTRWELTWTPSELGLAVLEVEVAPLDNERFLANNRATLAVDVEQDRARVLVLAPVPGWDVRFLAQAAHREPRLQLSVVRPGPTGPVLADSLHAWQAPTTAAGWRDRWEAVILAGSPGALLPDGGAQLAAAVRQGLGLLTIAGDPGGDMQPRSWPAALQTVLPVSLGRDLMRAGEYPVKAAVDAPRHPILAGITHGQDAAGVLDSWPPLQRLLPVRPGTDAEVLLEAGADVPLLVAAVPGEGRSLWFGGRRLWELSFWRLAGRLAVGSEGGNRLLGQMLLWTALGDQTAGISLLGQRLVFEEGEFVPVAARWLDLRGDPVIGRPLAVEVTAPDGGQTRVQALQADPLRPGIATADLPPLPPGRWRLVPRSLETPAEIGPGREIMVTRAERELAQVRQDRRNLRQTAARLGGVALDAGQPAQVARLLQEVSALDLRPRTSLRQARHEPAAGWPWLLAAVMLLAVEWLLRRRHGLL